MEELNMDELLALMEKGHLAELRGRLVEQNAVDIAEWFEELPNERALLIFRILPKDLSADVFSYLSPEQQEHIVSVISDREVHALVDEMFLDDTVDFLEEVPAGIVKKVLKNTDEHTRRLINQFLQYPENCAGSIMTIEFVDLKTSYTVRQAIDHIRRTGVDKETIYTCYVIDEQRRLLGTVALRKLLLSPEDELIADVMQENTIFAHTLMDQESVADMARRYDLLAVPVVDNEDRLVGIVTVDDILDVIEEENTEDFEKMAAMRPSEDEYMRTPVFTMARNRIVWLLVLMVSATLTGAVILRYDALLAGMVILTSHIPMLMDTGGNCGSQVATLVIRGMALGEIQMRDFWSVLWKELRVSLIVGVTLAAVNFVRIIAVGQPALVALVVSLSLIVTVVTSKLMGAMLPLAARRLRLDPAIMASPLITTIVDVTSMITFFSIATAFFGHMV